MFNLRRSVFTCLGWLAASELLCLVLAFSFALLPQIWARWMSLVCCLLAHFLLMANCTFRIAERDVALYRNEKVEMKRSATLLLSVLTAFPRFLLTVFLWFMSGSKLMLNLFILLNAPYIQIIRMLLGSEEPFAAVPFFHRVLISCIPFFTVLSVYISYRSRYMYFLKAEKVKNKQNPTDFRV